MFLSDPLSPNECTQIPANPDITGIGIRVSIYAQNLLSFIPAFYALQDDKVTPTELSQLEIQSSTILITAFAILLSTVIQANSHGITPYHGAVVLNLSWMNNTNLCIYFLLYFYSKVGEKEWQLRSYRIWLEGLAKALRQPVFWIGSAHLSLMAVVGLWLWSNPEKFGKPGTCSLSTSIFIVGGQVGFNAPRLRDWSILIYSLLLTPTLNLIFPFILFMLPFWVYRVPKSSNPSVRPVHVGLAVLGIIDIILVADTEAAIAKNKLLLEGGDDQWTFGQTLALLLLLLPARDIGEALYERRAKEWGEKLLDATARGDTGVMWEAIKSGAPKTILDDALAIATQSDQPKAVITLIEAAVGKEAKDQSMIIAVREGQLEIAEHLVDKGGVQIADVKGQIMNHWSLLYIAVKRRKRDVVQVLLDNGYDVNEKGSEPIFLSAIEGRNIDMVKLLLNTGANAEVQNMFGATPLHTATCYGNLDIIKLLLDNEADVQTSDEKSLLHFAAEGGNLAIFTLLLEKEADMHAKTSDETTILHSAVKGQNPDILGILLDQIDQRNQKSCINAKTVDEKTALQFAAEKGNLTIFQLLLEKGADLHAKNFHQETILHSAAKSQNPDVVRIILDKGMDAHAKSPSGKIPLHSAAEGGNIDIFNLLLDQGSDINAKNLAFSAKTPLHFAAENGNLAIVILLLEKKADLYAKTYYRESVLHSAAKGQNPDILSILLDKGMNVHVQTSDKKTPLHYAAESGNFAMVTQLLQKGADVHTQTFGKQTPLHFAAQGGNLAIFTLLLEKGANMHAQNFYGETTLHFAAEGENSAIFTLLFEEGIDVHAKTSDGKTVLHSAAQSQSPNPDLLKFLLDKGINVNAKALFMETPLHLAIRRKNFHIVKLLLDNGADVDAMSFVYNEGTPICTAARAGNLDIIKLLYDKGADINSKGRRTGITPLTYAKQLKHMHIVQFLQEKGATDD
ncbi:hypothetical protein C0992_001929 [Termitomyces sp. T32_za158]|nr:hypothetical protein C0992_001929 [Termitomyces sp. T32_za158]